MINQYVPKEHGKCGFEFWVRADNMNGYISDLDVYNHCADRGLGITVVMKVVVKLSMHWLMPIIYILPTSSHPFHSMLTDGL